MIQSTNEDSVLVYMFPEVPRFIRTLKSLKYVCYVNYCLMAMYTVLETKKQTT